MFLQSKLQIILLMLMLALTSCVSSQSKRDSNYAYTNTSVDSDINIFFKTGLKLYSSPAKFTGRDWIVTGSVLTITGLAFFTDESVRNFWQRNQSNTAGDILQIGAIYGNVGFAAAVAGSVYIGGKIFSNPEVAATGRMLIEGVFYSGLTTTVLKIATGRSRPYTNQGPYFFKPFQTSEPHVSFPSGHVTMAFTLSRILSNRIDNVYASVVLYSLAATTFAQRMYSDKHWLSDCILGASIGYFTGSAVIKFDEGNSKKKLSVLPFYEQKTIGLNIFYPI